MKVRNGFVSNSSSSSFVILGVKRQIEEDDDLECIWNWRSGKMCTIVDSEDNCYYRGFMLGESSDGYTEPQSFNSSQIDKMICDVMDAFDVDEDDVGIHVGTVSC